MQKPRDSVEWSYCTRLSWSPRMCRGLNGYYRNAVLESYFQ